MSKVKYFDKARSVYLPGFIRSQGIVLRAQGRSYGSPTCPICGTSDDKTSNRVSVFKMANGLWRWRCFVCGSPAASVIDYAAALWGVPPREASFRLANEDIPDIPAAEKSDPVASSSVRDEESVGRVIKAIQELGYTSVNEVMSYLTDQRGIPERLIAEAVRRGLVRMLPSEPIMALRFLQESIGEGLLKKAGFWKEGKKWPAISFRPLVFMLGKGGAEFRLAREPKADEVKSIRYGKLDFPFWWKGNDAKRVLLVEGAIDALSSVAMGQECHVMGIPGCQAWRPEWFDLIVKKYGSVEFIRGLDGDEGGQKADKKIAEFLTQRGYKHSHYDIPVGADWNKLLLKAA
jgi:hypothetical protein